MSLTIQLVQWAEVNKERLDDFDQVTLQVSDIKREKPSARLMVTLEDRFGDALVWDSGEVELSYGTARDPHDEHHELDDPGKLDGLLLGLLAKVG